MLDGSRTRLKRCKFPKRRSGRKKQPSCAKSGAKNVLAAPDLFFPMSAQPLVEPRGKGGSLVGESSPEMWWLNIMGRAKPGVPDAQAQAALDVSLSAAVEATIKPGSGDTVPRLILSDGSRGLFASRQMFGEPIVVLMAVVGLVLLLACANIASLLLSFLGRNALPALVSNPWKQNQFNSDFDWKIFVFTAAVTLATGLLFGIAPAWSATRTEVSSGLKETAQTTTRRRKGLGGKAIVAFQLMLSTVLVTGALLFVRTLWNVAHIDPGFRSDHLLLFAISQPEARYPPPTDLALHSRIEERLRSIPGVEAVTLSEVAFISDSKENSNFVRRSDRSA